MHRKCSQADIAHNSVNRSKAEQRTRTNISHSNKQMAERKLPILEEISVSKKNRCLTNE